MINLTIGNEKCKIPENWGEINLNDYSKLYSIINENKFEDSSNYQDSIGNVDWTEEQEKALEAEKNLHNIKLNQKVFAELTGIDKAIIAKVDAKEMGETLQLMTNFLNADNEKRIEEGKRSSFEYKGKKYFFPVAKMETSTFGDFIEAAQLDMLSAQNKAGKMGVIAEQMAILCREQGEEYDEDKVKKKKKMFGNLTMDIVWQFVFFLNLQINTYKKHTQMFSKKDNETIIDTQQNISKL